MSLNIEIKVMLLRKGLTITELAEKIGLPRKAVSARLNGHKDWNLSELEAVAKVFGVNMWELMKPAEEEKKCPQR